MIQLTSSCIRDSSPVFGGTSHLHSEEDRGGERGEWGRKRKEKGEKWKGKRERKERGN